jgi:cell division protein FtsW (lipid II flippase)
MNPPNALSLLFFSCGGSSYITFIAAAALLLNIYSRRFIHSIKNPGLSVRVFLYG